MDHFKKANKMSKQELKVFSMFTGIGGFEQGLKLSNINHKLIGYSEIDPYAIEVFENHFPGIKNYGDATKITGHELPEFDLLCGGFPCQAFSTAGHRQGFDDTRGKLFFDIARILSLCKPRYLVLENVKGLLTHEEGRTFFRILSVLTEMGYNIEWKIFNSKYHGVPQSRERFFITGFLGEQSRPKVLFD